MNNKDFVWTDELVQKYVANIILGRHNGNLTAVEILEQFKKEQLNSKKDWEIVEYRYGNSKPHKYISKENANGDYPCEEQGCKIYSVKRLTDGEIFTVGDRMTYNGFDGIWGGGYDYCTIEHFTINEGEIYVNSHFRGERRTILDWVKEKKQPLFKTEDGVSIFEGEPYAYIHKESLNWVNCSDGKYHPVPKDSFLYFSTKEKAEEYILLNKPVLSVNDILYISMYKSQLKIECGFNDLKELAKEKLNQ